MFVLACALLIIGLLGIVLPVLPGLPFLLAAAFLFTANSPGLRRRLTQSLRSRRIFRRVGGLFAPGIDGLTAFDRVKLGALRSIRRLLPKSRQ